MLSKNLIITLSSKAYWYLDGSVQSINTVLITSDRLNGWLVEVCVLHRGGSGLVQLDLACWVFGNGCFEQGVSGGYEAGLAQRPPQEAQNRGAEEDEDPGVDDGVYREEPQSYEISLVAAFRLSHGVDVHADLERRRR